jgi:hypothetical protein
MTKMLLPLLAGLLLLTGCARNYVISLNSGGSIRTTGKPHRENGFYYYKETPGGETHRIFASRVREIAPASMVSDPNAAFKSVQSK